MLPYSFMEDTNMAIRLNDLTTEQLSLLLNGLPLLSQAFWGPSEEWCEEIQRAAGTNELKDLGKIADRNDATQILTAYIETFNDLNTFYEILEADYVRLFISARGGITASLHQSSYESGDGRLMGRPAKMMASRLKASGLALPGEGSVPADHLAVEVEYLTLLLEGALGDGNEDLFAAALDFARTELKPWLEQLFEKLKPETDCPFYPATAHLLLGLVSLMTD
jgi:TorA maturation chaperone TorD